MKALYFVTPIERIYVEKRYIKLLVLLIFHVSMCFLNTLPKSSPIKQNKLPVSNV